MGACSNKDKKVKGKNVNVIANQPAEVEKDKEVVKTVKATMPPVDANVNTNAQVQVVNGENKGTAVTEIKKEEVFEVRKEEPGLVKTTNLEPEVGGLAISPDIRRAYAESCFIVGSPKYDAYPFEIITFNKTTNNLAYQLYQDETFNYLRDFNEFSAYCNGANKFYISGSDKKTEDDSYVSTFVEIDMANLNNPEHIKKLPNLLTGRGWHSMIFVPPKFVFIVGGMNTKSVELYDSETGQITHDSNLNENRSETTLCVINNSHLYAFCGFLLNHNYIKSIEKCNLKSKKRTWEIVNLITKNEFVFEPSFFSVAYGKGDSVILLGGSETRAQGNNNHNYVFELKDGNDTIDHVNVVSSDENSLCAEKFFMPINEKSSVLMPVYTSDVVKILLFDSEFNTLSAMKFEVMDTTEDEVRHSLALEEKGKIMKEKEENNLAQPNANALEGEQVIRANEGDNI